MTGWRQASETLDAMRVTDPAHAEYIDKLIDWCLAEGTRYACASVAAEAVRGIVHVGDVEWQVLTEAFGTPTVSDWDKAIAAYGPNPRLRPVLRCPQCGLDIAWSPVFEQWVHGEDSNSSYRCTYLATVR